MGVGIQRSLSLLVPRVGTRICINKHIDLSIRFIIDTDTDCDFEKYAMILRIYGESFLRKIAVTFLALMANVLGTIAFNEPRRILGKH